MNGILRWEVAIPVLVIWEALCIGYCAVSLALRARLGPIAQWLLAALIAAMYAGIMLGDPVNTAPLPQRVQAWSALAFVLIASVVVPMIAATRADIAGRSRGRSVLVGGASSIATVALGFGLLALVATCVRVWRGAVG